MFGDPRKHGILNVRETKRVNVLPKRQVCANISMKVYNKNNVVL